MSNGQKIIPVNIEEEMKTAYIDYSMSVIVSRAIPDARDGLKPVQRRILFGMNELGLQYNKPYKKSARIVGEVLGKYHPHGDSAVYEAMVRMAQPWSLRYPLVDGQGNYGSVDDDPPAAMRYTEARLERISDELLADIEKETVDFQLNFDDTLQEPTVLPSRIPNLLVNGASGIAVGMATNILPHNLSEVCEGIAAYIENRNITDEELVKIIPAPDFPTGGIIYGYESVRQGMLTGRGKVVVRARAEIEQLKNGRERIIISEIPYQVNKAAIHRQIVELGAEKIIDGIAEARDESDRDGIRLVIDLKKDAISNVVLNQLFKHTQLETSYSINNIALVAGRPRLLSLRQMIEVFVDFRHQVLIRKTNYELREAEKRAHILEGLLVALDHLDEVIALIRASRSPEEAHEGLMSRFSLSDVQAKAILDMRLQRLTGLEREKIRDEYKEVRRLIEYYQDVLRDEKLRFDILKDEILEIKKKYGDKRRTEIVPVAEELQAEDLIPDEEMVITVSRLGYVKRTAIASYRRQNRGGRGAIASVARDEDFIEHLFVASNHNYMLFFTEKGRCYWLKVYEIPEGGKTNKGRAIRNLINLPADDSIRAIINIKKLDDPQYISSNYLIFCTKKGIIKKTTLEEFSRPRSSGIIALSIKEGDQLLDVKLTNGKCDVLMAVRSGKAIRFHEDKVRPMGRTAAGVRGIDVDERTDEVIGMVCVNRADKNRTILVVSEKGFGKRTPLDEYRITNRGAKGVKTINITPKTGMLVAVKDVLDTDDLMIIKTSGVAIRMPVADIRITGRNTQGVRLIKLDSDDDIAAIARIENEEDEKPQNESNAQQGDIFSKN
ncbi:MAG: DNA gyrase subunit A [Chitinophagales bacterium]|nr:DNA gyrase subunit A [Chitinophagales bacterium]MDW8393376.1 DNA gyrase subunit A [Chitinophagales bacterium]